MSYGYTGFLYTTSIKGNRFLPLALGAVLAASCRSTGPLVPPTPSPSTNDATNPAADATRTAAAPDTSSSSVAKASTQAPAVAVRTQACEGTAVDLNWWLGNLRECGYGRLHKGEIPEASITARIQPVNVRARAGESVSLDYVLRNETDAPLTLWPHRCDMLFLEPEILGPDGKPVAKCSGGGGCSGATARLTLDARGTARLRFNALKTDKDTLCLEQPLPSGTYTIFVKGSGGLPDATGSLTIESTSQNSQGP